jgi:hypothetical protein
VFLLRTALSKSSKQNGSFYQITPVHRIRLQDSYPTLPDIVMKGNRKHREQPDMSCHHRAGLEGTIDQLSPQQKENA